MNNLNLKSLGFEEDDEFSEHYNKMYTNINSLYYCITVAYNSLLNINSANTHITQTILDLTVGYLDELHYLMREKLFDKADALLISFGKSRLYKLVKYYKDNEENLTSITTTNDYC